MSEIPSHEDRERIMEETTAPHVSGEMSPTTVHEKAAETAQLAQEVEEQLRPDQDPDATGPSPGPKPTLTDVLIAAEKQLNLDRKQVYRSPIFILLAAALSVILVLAATVGVAFVVTGSGFQQLRDVRSCDREFYVKAEIAKSNLLAAIGTADATILEALNNVAKNDDEGLVDSLEPTSQIVVDLQEFASQLRVSVAALDASVESCGVESSVPEVSVPPVSLDPNIGEQP